MQYTERGQRRLYKLHCPQMQYILKLNFNLVSRKCCCQVFYYLPLDFERAFRHCVLQSSRVFAICFCLFATEALKATELNKSVLVKQLILSFRQNPKCMQPGATVAGWETLVSIEWTVKVHLLHGMYWPEPIGSVIFWLPEWFCLARSCFWFLHQHYVWGLLAPSILSLQTIRTGEKSTALHINEVIAEVSPHSVDVTFTRAWTHLITRECAC